MNKRKIVSALLFMSIICVSMFQGFVAVADSDKSDGAYTDLSIGADNVIASSSEASDSYSITVPFVIEQAGEHYFKADYITDNDSASSTVISIAVDGVKVFEDAILELPNHWKSEGEIQTDKNGNDIRPHVEPLKEWISYTAYDSNDPSLPMPVCNLNAGSHIAEITIESKDVSLRNIQFLPKKYIPSYDEYIDKYKNVKKYSGEPLVLQAEAFSYSSSRFISPQNENSSPCTTPIDPYKLKINTIGGTSWQQAGEEISWKLDSVTEEGLYYFSARFLQNYSNGISVYRTLMVNGEIPFNEMTALPFSYNDQWQSESFGYYLYLKPGDVLSLRCTVGESTEIVKEIEDCIDNLNAFYSKITIITGTTPDAYFDYDIVGQIPDFCELANNANGKILALIKLIEEKYDANEAGFSSLYAASRLLETVAETPRLITAASRLSSLKSYIGEMGSLMTTIRNQPVLLDSISLISKEDDKARANSTFWQELVFRVKRVISTYINDYSILQNDGNKESIRVWVGTGRDQASILNEMIIQDFTAKKGISVSLELVQASLISANFSGTAPDVVLQRSETIDFAMRNALVELSSLEGFDELKDDYIKDAFIPFTYEDGIYGLPENMAFSMMYYRTDILDNLRINPPKSWTEVIEETLPTLSQNAMTMGIMPIGSCTSLFTTMLYQRGGKLYSDDYKTTALDTDNAYTAMQFATKLYTSYDIPTQYDSMSRFRSGEMPIVIESYAFANTLSFTVPELRGSWAMTTVPGTLLEDGTIENCLDASITGCFMLKNTKKVEESWEFMKWWIDSEQQLEYGIKQEAVLGAAGRYTPANLKTLQQLPWTREQLKSINSQVKELFCVPQIPGNYYLTRGIRNAFQNTVLSGANAREQLIEWNAQINMELERKREEFDYVPAFDEEVE